MPAPVGISLEDICVTACPAGQDQTVTSVSIKHSCSITYGVMLLHKNHKKNKIKKPA